MIKSLWVCTNCHPRSDYGVVKNMRTVRIIGCKKCTFGTIYFKGLLPFCISSGLFKDYMIFCQRSTRIYITDIFFAED